MNEAPQRACGSGSAEAAPRKARRGAGLGRARRRLHAAVFGVANAQKRCARGRLMVLWLREGPGAALRLGVVASRKVGGAVERARAKRLLREAYRLNRRRFEAGLDVVLVARADIRGATRRAVERELLYLAERAGLPARRGG
jgi:ribonuclease P protein component